MMWRVLRHMTMLFALVFGLALSFPGTARAATSTQAHLSLMSQTQWVASKGTVTSVVQVTGAPPGAKLKPVLHGAVATRSAFILTIGGQNFTGTPQRLKTRALTQAKTRVTVRISVSDGSTPDESSNGDDRVTLTRPGVYPVSFDLEDADGAVVASMVSYVVLLSDQPTEGAAGQQPLRVASEFRLTPLLTTDSKGAPRVPTAARKATESLVQGLSAASGPVRSSFGFALSPALMDTLARTDDSGLVDDIAQVSDVSPLQRLPWSPIPLARWLATPGLATDVPRLTDKGTAILRGRLHAPDPAVADLVAWRDPISKAAITWLADRSTSAVMVPADAMEPLDDTAFPRTLAAPFSLRIGNDREVQAVQLDEGLADHFRASDPVLGANQLLADLSVIALDLPSMSRGMVVAPPAGWNPSPAFLKAYAAGLGAAKPGGSVPLLAPTPLPQVVADTPPARAAGDAATTGPDLVRSLRSTNPPRPLPTLASGLSGVRAQLQSLATMVPGGKTQSAQLIAKLDDQLDLAGQPGLTVAQRNSRLAGLRARIGDIAGSPQLPNRQTITLTSENASLPITIRRPADGPTQVRVHVDARTRLSFPDGTSHLVRLDESTTHFTLRVHSDSPGDEVLRLTLTSPDNRITIGTTELVVRSTAASGVGLLISFGSLAFLLVWWGRDIFRRKRRQRANHVPPADLIDLD